MDFHERVLNFLLPCTIVLTVKSARRMKPRLVTEEQSADPKRLHVQIEDTSCNILFSSEGCWVVLHLLYGCDFSNVLVHCADLS